MSAEKSVLAVPWQKAALMALLGTVVGAIAFAGFVAATGFGARILVIPLGLLLGFAGIALSGGNGGLPLRVSMGCATVASYFVAHFVLYWASKVEIMDSFTEVLDLFVSVHLSRLATLGDLPILACGFFAAFLLVPKSRPSAPHDTPA